MRRRERGASLVETAIVLPLLLLLLAGVLDVGRAYYSYITIYNAAREGGRFAFSALSASDTGVITTDMMNQISDHVRQESAGTLVDLSDAAARTTITAVRDHAGDPSDSVRVTVEYDYDTFMGTLIGWDGEMQAHVVFPARP